jgi:hypothetical protein
MATYYHGSPNPDLTSLRSGSYITPDPELAKVFGRHNPETGKTWVDSDLREPYDFVGKPKFKRGSAPKGKASVYKLEASDSDVDFLDSPHEHTIRRELPVRRFNKPMQHFANFFSAQAEGAALFGVVNRQQIRLGTFDTHDEALIARLEAEKLYWGESDAD